VAELRTISGKNKKHRTQIKKKHVEAYEMMKIEVFGTGCMKCKRLMANVEIAVKELGIQAEIVKVEDIMTIMERGVMITPGLAVKGEMKITGHVANVKELKEILKM
jgi:small redox-active disulfide protein 2